MRSLFTIHDGQAWQSGAWVERTHREAHTVNIGEELVASSLP
jgi:hypothetical protein